MNGKLTRKVCSKCKKKKAVDQFNWQRKSKGQRQPACRTCTKKQQKQQYRKNLTLRIRRNCDRTIRHRKEVARCLFDYLLEHPCVDCGERNPVLLDPDHVRGDKTCGVSKLRNSVWEKQLIELQKCDIRCVRCHRLKTASEQKWAKVAWWEEVQRKTNLCEAR